MMGATESTAYIPVEGDFRLLSERGEQLTDNEFSGETSFIREAYAKFVSRKSNVAALVTLLLLLLLAIAAPPLSGYRFDETAYNQSNFAPRVPILEKIGIFDGSQELHKTTTTEKSNPYLENGITDYHLFGTDALGRDVFCRCFRGLRISLFVAVLSTLVNVIIGVSYGMLSGYFGGAVDMVMQRIIDVLGSIPQMVILTLLVLVLKPGIGTLIIAFMITGWISMSQIARAEVLRIKELEYVMASRTLGAGGFFIVFRGILPNILGPVISQIMIAIPSAIFMESTLSLMGLGISSGEVSLGILIQQGLATFFLHPHRLVPPIVIMVLTMISCNRLADGLRQALDPQIIL